MSSIHNGNRNTSTDIIAKKTRILAAKQINKKENNMGIHYTIG
jgi:hypothetical protein